MFLILLNEEQKKVFLKLAHHLALCDENLHEKEREYLSFYQYEMQINHEEVTNDLPIQKLDEIFTDELSKNILLTELIILANSDGIYSEKEKDFIKQISNVLHINDAELEILETWSKSFISILEHGKKLMKIK